MNSANKIVFMVMFFFSALIPLTAYALEKTTHESLNYQVVLKTDLDVYLNKQLGFSRGRDEEFKGKSVIDLISLGGKTEDEPFYTRSVNHYLDPIYNNIGFKGQFKNALEWAKNQSGVLLSTNCSWGATRGYYRQGLTSSTKTERETKLALTFECVGRLMHLVQDMSVPAHTRDDGHVA